MVISQHLLSPQTPILKQKSKSNHTSKSITAEKRKSNSISKTSSPFHNAYQSQAIFIEDHEPKPKKKKKTK